MHGPPAPGRGLRLQHLRLVHQILLSLHYEQGFTRSYEQYNGNLGQTWRGLF